MCALAHGLVVQPTPHWLEVNLIDVETYPTLARSTDHSVPSQVHGTSPLTRTESFAHPMIPICTYCHERVLLRLAVRAVLLPIKHVYVCGAIVLSLHHVGFFAHFPRTACAHIEHFFLIYVFEETTRSCRWSLNVPSQLLAMEIHTLRARGKIRQPYFQLCMTCPVFQLGGFSSF